MRQDAVLQSNYVRRTCSRSLHSNCLGRAQTRTLRVIGRALLPIGHGLMAANATTGPKVILHCRIRWEKDYS